MEKENGFESNLPEDDFPALFKDEEGQHVHDNPPDLEQNLSSVPTCQKIESSTSKVQQILKPRLRLEEAKRVEEIEKAAEEEHLQVEAIEEAARLQALEEERLRLEDEIQTLEEEQLRLEAEKAVEEECLGIEAEKVERLRIEAEEEAARLGEAVRLQAAEKERQRVEFEEPLSDEEKDRVYEALYGYGPLDEKLAVSSNDSVQRKSMHTLIAGQWLNDKVIHYFYRMLANRDEALSAATLGQKRSHFFMSFIFTKLFDKEATNQYRYQNVECWSENVPGKDIFVLNKLFFGCNVNGAHWTCAVVFMQNKKIQYFDSMSGSGTNYVQGLFQYLQDEWKAKKGAEMPDLDQWELVYGHEGDNIPQQHNGYDCGVFTCMFAYYLSVDRPLSFNQSHINQFRDCIALSILNGKVDSVSSS